MKRVRALSAAFPALTGNPAISVLQHRQKVAFTGVSVQGPVKLLIVLGTRPEAVKLVPLIRELQARPLFSLSLCHTGQHREISDRFLKWCGIVPDHDLSVMSAGQSPDEVAGRILLSLGPVIDREAPACVIVQGDTVSAAAAAQTAHYRRVPVAHVEAGLRSGDTGNPWPEEANRMMIAQLAWLHFAPTRHAARALRAEGIPDARIFVTGNTAIDMLAAMPAFAAAATGRRRASGVAPEIRDLLVTLHRREIAGGRLEGIALALRALGARSDVRITCLLHPNRTISAPLQTLLANAPGVVLRPPLDYPQCLDLLARCDLVLTDSGGLQEEAPALGKPVVILRDTTERPEAILAGSAILAGTAPDAIIATTSRLLDDPAMLDRMSQPRFPFGRGQASRRICDILEQRLVGAER
jgi:UDP-N-acetylglucosamine 2-epimerase (non-hydrolysing)